MILQLLEIQLGDAATWAAAFGTVGALSVALWGLRSERDNRLADETRRQTAARRSQAEQVCAWYGGSSGEASGRFIVRNNSNLPVYDAVMTVVLVQGAGPATSEQVTQLRKQEDHLTESSARKDIEPEKRRAEVFVVPPGTWEIELGFSGGMFTSPGVEIAFRDAAGMPWIRRARGTLDEIPSPPFDYLEVSMPTSGERLKPAAPNQ